MFMTVCAILGFKQFLVAVGMCTSEEHPGKRPVIRRLYRPPMTARTKRMHLLVYKHAAGVFFFEWTTFWRSTQTCSTQAPGWAAERGGTIPCKLTSAPHVPVLMDGSCWIGCVSLRSTEDRWHAFCKFKFATRVKLHCKPTLRSC